MKQIIFYSIASLLSFAAKAQASKVEITSNATKDTICIGTIVTFKAQTDNGCVPAAYQWRLNGAPIPGATADTFSTASLATGDSISVEAAADPGCNLPAVTYSNSIGFYVNSAPAAPGMISGNNGPCLGLSSVYTITAVAGATSYVWSAPLGWHGSSTTRSISLAPGIPGDITVVAVNACGSSLPSSLTVNPQSNPPLPPIAGKQVVCAGSTEIYSVNAPGWSGFSWVLPPGWSGMPSANSISCVASNASGTIYATANSACGATTMISLFVKSNANVTPAVSISTPNTTVCPGTQITFGTSSTNAGIKPDYKWMLNGNFLNTTGPSLTMDSVKSGDVVRAYLFSSEQCVSVNNVPSNDITMNVLPSVVPTVQVSANRTMPIPIGTVVTYMAGSKGGGSTPKFQWLRNGLPIALETKATFTDYSPRQGDTISVRMTSSAACATQTEVTSNGIGINIASRTGVNEALETWSGTVTIYPNPSNGQFFVVGNWGSARPAQNVQVELLNMMGQPVYSTSAKVDGAEWRFNVHVGERVANGMYLLKLSTEDMQTTQRVMIQR